MTPEIKQFGNVLITLCEVLPSPELFRRSPVWHQYYVPDELDMLRAMGMTDQEIIMHIHDPCQAYSQSEAYFSFDKPLSRKPTEFTYIRATVFMKDVGFDAHALYVLGEFRGVTLFLDEDVIFNTAGYGLLARDHMNSLAILSRRTGRNFRDCSSFFYELHSDEIEGIALTGQCRFDVPPDLEVKRETWRSSLRERLESRSLDRDGEINREEDSG